MSNHHIYVNYAPEDDEADELRWWPYELCERFPNCDDPEYWPHAKLYDIAATILCYDLARQLEN